MGKKQHWKSLGRVFCSAKNHDWMQSYASYPVALPLHKNCIKILFSPRDKDNKSHIGWLDLELSGESFKVEGISDEPILSPGTRGAFDDAGVTVGSVVKTDRNIDIYYLGWTLTKNVPFTNFIGMAQWDLIGPSQRYFIAPVIGRSEVDPYSVGYPWVMELGGERHIWYGSHNFWGPDDMEMEHVIRHGRSKNGLVWSIDDKPAIDISGGDEFAVSRPCVVKTEKGYHMWYARRFGQYKPGYAFSEDLQNWRRLDDVFIMDNRTDWDSDAITYISVFTHGGRHYMLYNGNGYGKTGFGLAILEGEV